MKIIINNELDLFGEIKKKYRVEIALVFFAMYAVARKITKREKEITKLKEKIKELKSKGE